MEIKVGDVKPSTSVWRYSVDCGLQFSRIFLSAGTVKQKHWFGGFSLHTQIIFSFEW